MRSKICILKSFVTMEQQAVSLEQKENGIRTCFEICILKSFVTMEKQGLITLSRVASRTKRKRYPNFFRNLVPTRSL
jgi:hypothetical protein